MKSGKTTSERLDVLLVQRGLCATREQAQGAILAGEVWSEEKRLDKPGTRYPNEIPLELKRRAPRFVSRGGEKLEHALDTFHLSVDQKECLDLGASTGGFVDCMLQRGARRVFAVDVGHGQLDSSLRSDPRVICRERVNARSMSRLEIVQEGTKIALVTIDVSFISLEKILPNAVEQFPEAEDWICLFKPQFELEPSAIGKKGIVRHPELVPAAIEAFSERLRSLGLEAERAAIPSPIAGKKSGNQEYLVHYRKKRGR